MVERRVRKEGGGAKEAITWLSLSWGGVIGVIVVDERRRRLGTLFRSRLRFLPIR